VRCRALVVVAQIIGMAEVVPHHSRFAVRHVLQLMTAVDVAERPHTGACGETVAIDLHRTTRINLDP